jgi:glycosyltransferase involved in cell wall biosynthesis
LLIRGPTPLLPTFARAFGDSPIVLLLVGDNLAGVDDLKQPNWRRELIRAYWRWNKSQQTRVARRSLTFVNSQALYNELSDTIPNLRLTRTTTLSQDDFFERRDTCGAAPYRLLYTGRLDRAKGLLDMVEALALLVEQDEPVMLDLVGWPQAGDSILQEIERLAQARGVSGRVRYHGFQPLGPELFAFYKTADIYLIASQSSEGFPRTIWEAMAHSLPVVATRVGSIPDYVQDAAELVPPRQPEALAAGITRLIHDPSLRTARIAAGIRLARENTLESQTTRMCAEIESWLNTFN